MTMNRWMSIAMVLIVGSVCRGEDSRTELARQLAPILAKPPATGLLIWEVADGSQAHRAGFRVGDVLTHYDGQEVATPPRLVELARAAAREGRTRLLVLARRGEAELDAECDAAPLGVRLVPIKAGAGRQLWRPQTPYQPVFEGLDRAVGSKHRWDLVVLNGEVIGWVRSYLARQGQTLALRTQSRVREHDLDIKRDATTRFVADRYLSPQSMRLVSQDKLIVELVRRGAQLEGARTGVPVTAPLPGDCIVAALAGYVAASMPLEQGACLRSSYLGDASISAAPFADLYCIGPETLIIQGTKTPTHRFEQTVFGESVAHYWVDPEREVVQTQLGNGIQVVRADQRQVVRQFPDAGAEFEPIEKLPAIGPTPPIGN